jgi:hypothetical protein
VADGLTAAPLVRLPGLAPLCPVRAAVSLWRYPPASYDEERVEPHNSEARSGRDIDVVVAGPSGRGSPPHSGLCAVALGVEVGPAPPSMDKHGSGMLANMPKAGPPPPAPLRRIIGAGPLSGAFEDLKRVESSRV